jgi:chaperonin cofactor prefoldin
MEKEKEDELLKMLMNKVQTLEKKLEDIRKRQQALQDAFYKIYEDQRRRERGL